MAKVSHAHSADNAASPRRDRVELESTNGVYIKGPKTWELYRVASDSLEEFVRFASPLEVELLQALVSR
jgi:hypothetical protein